MQEIRNWHAKLYFSYLLSIIIAWQAAVFILTATGCACIRVPVGFYLHIGLVRRKVQTYQRNKGIFSFRLYSNFLHMKRTPAILRWQKSHVTFLSPNKKEFSLSCQPYRVTVFNFYRHIAQWVLFILLCIIFTIDYYQSQIELTVDIFVKIRDSLDDWLWNFHQTVKIFFDFVSCDSRKCKQRFYAMKSGQQL